MVPSNVPRHATSRRRFLRFSALLPVTVLAEGCTAPGEHRPEEVQPLPTVTAGRSTGSVRNLLVIGDSFSTGLGTSPGQAWPELLRTRLTAQEPPFSLENASENGSGYLTAGVKGGTFGSTARSHLSRSTSVVLFVGSVNDLGQDRTALRAAATRTLQEARNLAPQARTVAIGPPSFRTETPPELMTLRDALRDAAGTAGVEFVDPIQAHWMRGPDQAFVGPDGLHPNAAGQEHLALGMAEVLGLT